MSSTPGAAQATHYIVLCELKNLIEVFKLNYTGSTINFTPVQEISSFAPGSPPPAADAGAGEIHISPDGKNVYITNRLTGEATDNLVRFGIVASQGGSISLQPHEKISSGGILPRMFSLGLTGFEDFIFLANQQGNLGLLAFKKNADGSVNPEPVASLPMTVFSDPSTANGPQFVQQILS